jgi:2-C-methyl-D-erythritol 4-phosphate cytidylyltransferase
MPPEESYLVIGQDRVGAVVVAAGQSRRFGRDKLFEPLQGRPVLAWSLTALNFVPVVDEIVLVTSRGSLAQYEAFTRELQLGKLTRIVPGGARRQDSVRCGLHALGKCDWALIHDGARPLVTEKLICDGLEAVRATGAAVPGVPLKDTVKQVDARGLVTATPDRSCLRAIQTPQVFAYDLLVRAHASVSADVTDDAAMIEAIGGRVVVFEGDPANIKITTEDDLATCAVFLSVRRG